MFRTFTSQPRTPAKLTGVDNLLYKCLGDAERHYIHLINNTPDYPLPGNKTYSKHIIVLGAGIAGLQTALSLRCTPELHDVGISVIADAVPGAHREGYCSPQAGGHWRSHVGVGGGEAEERLRGWDRRTYEYWMSMWPIRNSGKDSDDSLIPEEFPAAERWTGLGRKTARYYWGRDGPETVGHDGSGLWWNNVVTGFRTLNPRAEIDSWYLEGWGDSKGQVPELPPLGAIMGVEYGTFCFNPDTYLRRRKLLAEFLDVKIFPNQKLPTEGGLSGVIQNAKQILLEKLNPRQGSDDQKNWAPSTLRPIARAIGGGHSSNSFYNDPNAAGPLNSGSNKKSSNDDPVTNVPAASGYSTMNTATQESNGYSATQGLLREEDIIAVINCTGLSARNFVGEEEASLLYPTRGQTIIVEGEAACCRTYAGFPDMKDGELLYVVPRPGTNTTVLGGCKQDHNDTHGEDKELKKRIIELVKKYHLADELRTGLFEDFQIVTEYRIDPVNPGEYYDRSKLLNVGFRPSRKGGPRVELERENGGKVDGTWVLHNYGHGGGGYQSSVGCAEEIARLVKGVLFESGIPHHRPLQHQTPVLEP